MNLCYLCWISFISPLFNRDEEVVAVASLMFDPVVSRVAELMATGQIITKAQAQWVSCCIHTNWTTKSYILQAHLVLEIMLWRQMIYSQFLENLIHCWIKYYLLLLVVVVGVVVVFILLLTWLTWPPVLPKRPVSNNSEILLLLNILFSHFIICSELMTWAGCRYNRRLLYSGVTPLTDEGCLLFPLLFLVPKSDFSIFCLRASESQSDLCSFSQLCYHRGKQSFIEFVLWSLCNEHRLDTTEVT